MASQPITDLIDTHLNVIEYWIGKQFHTSEMAKRAIAYIKGLLTEVPANNGRWKAQADQLPLHGLKYLLNKVTWNPDVMRDNLQEYVVRYLAEPDGVLVLSELDFFKQSTRIAGVSRQYSSSRGRIQNCQTGLFLTYATDQSTVILDRALYLPKDWLEDKDRAAQAEIPDTSTFSTKPDLGRDMLIHALNNGIPFRWLAGSSVFGTDRHLRVWLEKNTIPFVFAVPADHLVWCELGQIAAEKLMTLISSEAWSRIPSDDNATSYEWTSRLLPRWNQPCEMEHRLLIRRNVATGELAYYVTYVPAGTTLRTLVYITQQQAQAEHCLQQARERVNMGYYRGLKWTGWYKHITLAMWALIYFTVMQPDFDAGEASYS